MKSVIDSETGDDGREPFCRGAAMVRLPSRLLEPSFVRPEPEAGSLAAQMMRDYGPGGVADRIAMGLINPRDFARTR